MEDIAKTDVRSEFPNFFRKAENQYLDNPINSNPTEWEWYKQKGDGNKLLASIAWSFQSNVTIPGMEKRTKSLQENKRYIINQFDTHFKKVPKQKSQFHVDIRVKITKKETSERGKVTTLGFDIVKEEDKKWFGEEGFIRINEIAIKEMKRTPLHSCTVTLGNDRLRAYEQDAVYLKVAELKEKRVLSIPIANLLFAKRKSDKWLYFLEEMKERRNKEKRKKEKSEKRIDALLDIENRNRRSGSAVGFNPYRVRDPTEKIVERKIRSMERIRRIPWSNISMTSKQRDDLKGLTKQDKIAYYVRNIWLPLKKEQALKKREEMSKLMKRNPNLVAKKKNSVQKALVEAKRMQKCIQKNSTVTPKEN